MNLEAVAKERVAGDVEGLEMNHNFRDVKPVDTLIVSYACSA